ncbi:unnamed protein product [Linum trigynum]|uniref:Uncharacterized protein n=1 Tax=Linum trigynum TaxID=586398 RepID=A0AAV2DID9_9ROSI
MGNCLFGGLGDGEGGGAIRVITSTGAILEFHLPITAGCLAAEFPGHAIFPSHDLFWTPLSHDDQLRRGNSYYLLPLTAAPNSKLPSAANRGPSSALSSVKEGHVRSKSSPSSLAGLTPYRMSLDSNYKQQQQQQGALKRSYTEAFSLTSSVSGRAGGGGGKVQNQEAGFWKVKLVISPDQLLQILSQEASTHDLVHNVSAVAKCGGSSGYSTLTSNACSAAVSSSSSASSVVGFSDDWIATAATTMSTGTSRNGSAKKDHHSMVDLAVASN